jgi:flagellar biosynthesis/type III secretory pathway protein FliH
MARVIKGGIGAGAARPATRVLAQADVKKVIEKETFLAKQEAGELLKRAEDERRTMLAEGKQLAAQAREEAMTRGASEAFSAAAAEALVAFRRRADRYGEAADDIRILAVEIARKLLGTEPDLAQNDIDRIVAAGLSKLRAKRKLRVLVAPGRRASLQYERPNLIKAVDAEPDLLLEEAADVGVGYARVVTEVGGALCAEDSALEALAEAVNVKEIPRSGSPRHPNRSASTQVGHRVPAGVTGVGDDDDSVEEWPASASAEQDSAEDLPDAAVDEDHNNVDEFDEDSIDDDVEDFRDLAPPAPLPAPLPRPRLSAPLPAPIAPPRSPQPVSSVDRAPVDRVPIGRVQAQTRAVAVADVRAAAVDIDDDDLDLFTDARPIRPR